MATETINTRDIPAIAKELRKKVNNLLLVYFSLILGTFVIFLAIIAGAILITISMVNDGYLNFRLIGLLVFVVIIAGACVKFILTPLTRLFDKNESNGTEIYRKDYPELFTIIDEIVQKAGCAFPKHVYINHDCNASVGCRSIWGHIFNTRKNLSIGLPLLYSLNKTEFKAILSHEFGHFTQKSLAINNTANLSQFICTALAQTQIEFQNADPESYESNIRWFAAYATKIMAKQYNEVAPLNGILSRALEFEADLFSYSIAGTEATISALSKTGYFSGRWRNIISALYEFVEKRRCPADVLHFVERFNASANELQEVKFDNNIILDTPEEYLNFNVIVGGNTATHPPMYERCNAIKEQSPIPTTWDKTPALSFFGDKTTREMFNKIPAWLGKIKFPLDTAVFLKKNVTDEELDSSSRKYAADHLQYFYNGIIFADSKGHIQADEAHPEYEAFPFTEQNSLDIQKYNRDMQDLYTLEQIVEENSPSRKFTYFGQEYTGVNVPIQEHREFTEHSYNKAIEIVRHCNHWLTQKTAGTELEPIVYLMLNSVIAIARMTDIQEQMEIVHNIHLAGDKSTKAKEYIRPVEEYFRQHLPLILAKDENGTSLFDLIANLVQVDEKVAKRIYAFYNNPKSSLDSMLWTYQNLTSIINHFRIEAWNNIINEVVIPAREK